MPRWLARHRVKIAAAALGLMGAWLALVAFGTTHGVVGPLQVEATISPTVEGNSVININPIGTLELNTHDAPITLDVRVRSVDVAQVDDLVDDPSTLTELDEGLVSDISDLLVEAAVRSAIVAILGAAIGAALVFRSVRHTLIAAATAVAAVVGTYGLAALTYDENALREPTYTGLLELAPQIVGSAEEIAANFDAYAEQLASIVTSAALLYNTTLSLPTSSPDDDAIRVLHISDLHLNVTSWDVIEAVSDQYEIDVIVDSGDIADHGYEFENAYVESIAGLGRPYVFVKGNHDSVTTEAAVKNQPNAVVLDSEPVDVAGLRFLGAPDPRFTPDQTTRDTVEEDIFSGTQELADIAASLSDPADVIVYHDPAHAELFDETAPLVLSGHRHRRETYVLDSGQTRVFVQGSTGGAGLRALDNEEPTPVMLSVLYFDPDSKELVAWDDLTLGGIGLNSAKIERQQASGETRATEDDEEPSPSPSPTDSGLEN